MAVAKKAPTLGSLIDSLNAAREVKRKLAEQVKVAEESYKALEVQIMEALGKEEVTKGTGKTASVSITTVTVADVTDWDALFAFMKKTGHFHLLQRRMSDPAYRELLELPKSKGVPGVQPFIKKNLNLRSITA